MLGYNLDTAASAVRTFPEASLDGSAHPYPLTLTAGLIEQIISGVPQRDRYDIDTTSWLVGPDGYQIAYESGPGFEYPCLRVGRQPATKDDEIEIHRISPFNRRRSADGIECVCRLGQILVGQAPGWNTIKKASARRTTTSILAIMWTLPISCRSLSDDGPSSASWAAILFALGVK